MFASKWLNMAAVSTITALVLAGCGGGSSSDISDNSNNDTPTVQTLVGTFIDGAVSGIDYSCTSTSGTTDVNGNFNYVEGDSCTFKLGDLTLGSTTAKGIVTPADIVSDNEQIVNLGVLLQSLDSDNDTSNGITIDDATKSNISAQAGNVNFESYTQVKSALEAIGKTVISQSDAIEHLKFNGVPVVDKSQPIAFKGIPTPITAETKATEQSTDTVYVNGEKQTIGFSNLLNTGASDNGEIFGLSKDYQDNIITFEDGSPFICNGTNSGAGSGLDFTSFLNVNDKIYMVSQFECGVGSLYMTELEQNATTGALTAKSGTLQFISQKDEFGGWVHCAGQKTPWESHLGSEEYETDAKTPADHWTSTYNYVGQSQELYWKDAAKFSPYYYGWTPEIKVDASGAPVYTKHYAMGRFSHELAYVMPDEKTVYLSDDGTNVGLFMYVADTAKDLAAGTLYAAKWTQTSSTNGGSANISWVNLGHATNSEIRAMLDPDGDVTTNDALTFTDIFDIAEINEDNTCPSGFTSINSGDVYQECLKIKTGMEKAASRLETRRYAALMGATTEFRKEEGITFDAENKKLYIAMSSVERGMEDNAKGGVANTKYDIGGNNHIKVDYNKCGAIYELNVDNNYQATDMTAILTGIPKSYDADSEFANNSCDVNAISNPDNVTFLEGTNILVIGEDTGKHENNIVWAYNTDTKALTRIFTTPLDAETTSPFWYKDLNGFGYLSVVTQHPMGDQETDSINKESSIGYVGPFNFSSVASIDTTQPIAFKSIPTPITAETKATEQSTDTVYVNGEKQTIGFSNLLNTGASDNGEIFGLSKDYQDNIITFEDGSPFICNGTNSGAGSGLDFTSFLNVNDKIYMVSQFECGVGSLYMTELEQNATTGALTAKSGTLQFISQKDEFGGWVHCAGQKTPWESHLGSEEYETDAKTPADHWTSTYNYVGQSQELYWKDAAKFSPYYYGWTPEIKVDASGAPVYTKHYAMGRFSHELAYVMPDEKTVYLSDDGTNVGLFMYVADTAKDLAAGTLYAAKWTQTSSTNGGSANISWVNLGHATNSEIRAMLDPDGDVTTNDALTFTDIFDIAEINEDNTCPSGFTSINSGDVYQECLKIKTGMEKAASRLETRRYAALMGATTEFRKEEGITFDAENKKLYIAMSSVERGMEDNAKGGVANTKYDIGGNNHIKVDYNKCGAIYELNVDNNYQATDMTAILTGIPKSYDADSEFANNSCDVNAISNPDNVTFLEGTNILVIGEDTGKHENNIVWAYNTDTKALTRIFTTPLDAETTSPFWYKDLNGFGYLSVVTQHPMGDQETDSINKESSIGYVGPFNFSDL